MATLPVIADAWIGVKDGLIAAYEPMDELGKRWPGQRPATSLSQAQIITSSEESSLQAIAMQVIDARGRYVFPSFVDSHTHLVFAASREEEFVMKLKGASYADIAAKGGGILNSARKLQQTSEDELFERSVVRAHEIIRTGTGTVEIKSGYGLTTR